jgi:hypothetical protein
MRVRHRRPPATIGQTKEERMDIVPLGPGFAAELEAAWQRVKKESR